MIVASLILFWVIFFPTIKNEIKYLFSKKDNNAQIVFDGQKLPKDPDNVVIPADPDFSVIIPKIGANSKIVAGVDPLNEREYMVKLKEGVAHAKGSGFPDDDQTVFLFAHSSENFYNSNRYNSIFYLLRKLETGDDLHLVYKERVYDYKVSAVKISGAGEVDYLQNTNQEASIILMTCWPPGTAYKRLLVIGEDN